MSNFSTGKIAFADRLGLIDSDSRRFIQKLSEMRNDFVHSVSFVGTTLEAYIASLSAGDQKGLLKAFRWGYKAAEEIVVKVGEDAYDLPLVLKRMALIAWDVSPKGSIWMSSQAILWSLARNIARSRLDRQVTDLRLELLDQVLETRRAGSAHNDP
jgi:hypothetical protein